MYYGTFMVKRGLPDGEKVLFYLLVPLLLSLGVFLALIDGHLLLLLLEISIPVFLLLVHLKVLPLFTIPLIGGVLMFDRSCELSAGEASSEFTAIVPVKDDAGVIEECVESILRHPLAEVLIVYESDNSDSTAEEARKLAGRERVEALRNTGQHSGSKAGALNFALEKVDSELVAIFDADHEAIPEAVDAAVSKLEEDPELSYISGRTLKKEDDLPGKIGYGESLFFHQLPSLLTDKFFKFHLPLTTNSFFRRSHVLECGGFDPSVLTEDMELGVRLFLDGRKTSFEPSVVSMETSARTMRDWWDQKKRWMRGSIQVSRLHALKPLLNKPGLPGAVLSALLVVLPLSFPMSVLGIGYLAFSVAGGSAGSFLTLVLPGILVAYLARSDSKRGLSHRASPLHVLSSAVLLAAGFVGLKALIEEALGTTAEWTRISR